MKVHNLTIDSSLRDVNVYPLVNSYVITLENPIYDVSELKLASARIPTPQLTICDTNNTFSVDGQTIVLENADYPNGDDLATHLQNELAPPTSNVSEVSFDTDTKRFTFSNVGTSNTFTFEFFSGINGRHDDSALVTTPHQLLGFSSADQVSDSNVLVSGAINLVGPNSLILRLTAGSDEFTQSVYAMTPFYTGHILLDGSDFINFNGADDILTHHFHKGPQKYIKDLKVEFFYMSHGRLIPYDFMNQEHVLKFEMTCSTDKLKNLPKVPIEPVKKEEEKTTISVPEILENPYRWKKEHIYIGVIVLIGIILIMLMKKKPISG